FKQGLDFEPLPQPVPVKGAVAGSSSVARGTTALWTFHQGPGGLYEAKVRAHTAASASTCKCRTQQLLHSTVLLHHRLGHLGEDSMKKLIASEAIVGLPKSYTPPPLPFSTGCLPCIQGKTQATPHPSVRSRAAAPLDRIHCDLVGPLPPTLRGHRWHLTIVDDHSRNGWTILLHNKAQAKQAIIEWITQVQLHTGRKLKYFHSDRGGEFLNSQLLTFFRHQGIMFSFSNPHSPEQNGVAEARNKSIGRITRTLLEQASAPLALWGYAVLHATLLNNLVPHALLEGKTPYEAWSGVKPTMRRLRVWGCTAHVLQNKSERQASGGKLGPVTKTCIHVGINPHGPGWLFLDSNNKECPSSDAVFQEHAPHHASIPPSDSSPTLEWIHFDHPSAPPSSSSSSAPINAPPSAAPPSVSPSLAQDPRDGAPHEVDSNSEEGVGAHQDAPSSAFPSAPQALPPLRRSTRERHPPTPYWIVPPKPSTTESSTPDSASTSDACVTATTPPEIWALLQTIANGESGDKRLEIPTPQTWQEALGGADSEEWFASMVREYNGIKDSGTFEEVPRPPGANVVKSKWVYRVKRRPDGTPHFKSRLCAKGFSQKLGVDYLETFAPTPRHTTARLLLHLAAKLDLLVHVMDVDQAFLHGELEEEIFMEPPPCMGVDLDPNVVWRLKKPLYGLKQAPRQWHTKLKGVLQEMGFQPAHWDPSLFLLREPNGMWVLVYVDDLLLLSNSTEQLERFKATMLKHFPMKDLGEINTYLGMQVTRDLSKHEIHLSQKRFIQSILKRFGQEDIRTYNTPLAVNHNLTIPQPG
ncbi:hypothetical protein EBS40_09175, partial [bacterium]|nr:hypothetical protein [bacterium]